MLSNRFYAFILVLTALLVATALVGTSGGALSTGDALPTNRTVNLIAYVDFQGRIQTIAPDGLSPPRAISPETGFYTWPVWSPDARSITFSGTAPAGAGKSPLQLYVSRLEDEETRVIYTNQPGLGPILPGMPHYPIWSPDSTQLAFMASVSDGLTLFLDDVFDDNSATVVLRDTPLYASWSADSRYVMVHAGIGHVLVDAKARQTVTDAIRRGIGYRTPAWWPLDSEKVALLLSDLGARKLYITDVGTGEETLIDEVEESAAFLWSPNGRSLAVAKSRVSEGLVSPRIVLYSPDGARQPIDVEGNIRAYFWSPDSSKLAYVVLTRETRERGVLRVMVLDAITGDRWPVLDFTPTPDQSTVFDFFDQFAYSHSPWSPDSRSLVLAGTLRHEGTSVSLSRQPGPQIYVVDASPNPAVTPIAEGFLAFWSPR